MAAAAAGAIFEIKDVPAGLTDEQLQDMASGTMVIDDAPAKTSLRVPFVPPRWNNLAGSTLRLSCFPDAEPKALPHHPSEDGRGFTSLACDGRSAMADSLPGLV